MDKFNRIEQLERLQEESISPKDPLIANLRNWQAGKIRQQAEAQILKNSRKADLLCEVAKRAKREQSNPSQINKLILQYQIKVTREEWRDLLVCAGSILILILVLTYKKDGTSQPLHIFLSATLRT